MEGDDDDDTFDGELFGVSRWARCFSAAFLYLDGSSRGLGAAFDVGHDMLYPPAPCASEGWMSKLSAATPSCIFLK